MFTAFKQKMSLTKAILAVSILFGISHMSLIKVIPTAILGAALAYAIHKADSIVASGMMHFLNNGFAVFVMYYGDKIPFLSEEQMAEPVIIGMAVLAVVCIPVGLKILNSKNVAYSPKGV